MTIRTRGTVGPIYQSTRSAVQFGRSVENLATLKDLLDMTSSSTYHRRHEESGQPCVEEGQRRLKEVIDYKKEGKRVGKTVV